MDYNGVQIQVGSTRINQNIDNYDEKYLQKPYVYFKRNIDFFKVGYTGQWGWERIRGSIRSREQWTVKEYFLWKSLTMSSSCEFGEFLALTGSQNLNTTTNNQP